jgi:GNAT superfamily N-acetyltransferase
MTIEVVPVTEGQWDDLAVVFGRRAASPSSCWCRLWSGGGRGVEGNRDALLDEIRSSAVPPGLIAYDDGAPVAWARIGRRDAYPLVTGNRALAKLFDPDPDAWWAACFVVRADRRRTGVGAALLAAAVEFAGGHGARVVEGYPVDVAVLTGKAGTSSLYPGTLALFTGAGFEEIGRTVPARPLVRKVVQGRTGENAPAVSAGGTPG